MTLQESLADPTSSLRRMQQLAGTILSGHDDDDDRIQRLAALANGVIMPTDLLNQEALTELLMRVFFQTLDCRALWLVEALIAGLSQGHARINATVGPPDFGEAGTFPLLFWVCKWKLLERMVGWQGREDIVSLVLTTPGIDVNVCISNKTNALFFATKYGSAETIQLLKKAGINMKQRDQFNRTALYNLLEYPDPRSLQVLLEHLPANEMFDLDMDYSCGAGSLKGSTVDRIMDLYVTLGTMTEEGKRIAGLLSWIKLGKPPPIENVADSVIMLIQKGASFTPEGSKNPWEMLGYTHQERLPAAKESEDFMKLGQSILGFWLPPLAKKHIAKVTQETEDSLMMEECPICLNSHQKPLTLSCGHTYCRKCIVLHAQEHLLRFCLLCRQPLCRDLMPQTLVPSEERNGTPDNQMGNLPSQFQDILGNHLRNLLGLSDNQIMKEAIAQGFFSIRLSKRALRSQLIESIVNGHNSASQMLSTECRLKNGVSQPISVIMTMEMSTTYSVTSETFLMMKPGEGPVMVQIIIKGIPVMAHISNNSRYTVLSSTVVNNFALERLPKLSSAKFRDGLTGKRMKDSAITCLKKFDFSIGGVDVTLRNAVEISPDFDGVGVQLGQDFLLSGRLCLVDVNIEGNCHFCCDGLMAWPVPDGTGNKAESLRYYAHNGQSCNVPLYHFNPNKEGRSNAITLKFDAALDQCNWCNRNFPQGMFQCTSCNDALYCGEECLKAAWNVHKERCSEIVD